MEKSNIIPVPKSYIANGEKVSIKAAIAVEKPEWAAIAGCFSECFEKIFGIGVKEEGGGVRVVYDESISSEAYRIEVDAELVIYASEYRGAAYGAATALQLLSKTAEGIECPAAVIEDAPDKDYRCLMVDVARRRHPFGTLLHYVDLCFFYKVKYLHLHFADDQSYTLPSKAFARLPAKNWSYSFEEIEKLRAYANSRGVVIVPEIEMPGHAKALNNAYPEVFADKLDEGADIELVTEGGVAVDKKSLICAGSAQAYEGITKLIDEVVELFPESPMIHLGGDEANIGLWEKCGVCRDYMKKHNLADAEELYCEFTARVSNYLLSKGRTPIIWEGFPKKYADKISKDVIIIGWENYYQTADSLIEEGFRVINGTWQPLYVVPSLTERWNAFDILKWNVYEWQHWWDNSAAKLNPIHIAPTEQVIGAQICVWRQTYEREIAYVAENLAAMSERTWSVQRKCDDDAFKRKLDVQSEKLFALIAE